MLSLTLKIAQVFVARDVESAEEEARNARYQELKLLNGYLFFRNDRSLTLPGEIIEAILSQIDHEDLLTCHFVCKNWKTQIQNNVWRLKASMTVNENFSHYQNVPWQVYHWICKTKRNPFEKNLLKNHSGENGLEDWTTDLPQNWTVENPPVGVPELPVDKDPIFEGKQFCFATHSGSKSLTVDLKVAGFHSYILDKFRPLIEISEWVYDSKDLVNELFCELQTDNNTRLSNITTNSNITNKGKKNKWQRYKYEAKNYRKGLRKIYFFHSGRSSSKIISCKIAGTCIKIKFPYITARGRPSDNR